MTLHKFRGLCGSVALAEHPASHHAASGDAAPERQATVRTAREELQRDAARPRSGGEGQLETERHRGPFALSAFTLLAPAGRQRQQQRLWCLMTSYCHRKLRAEECQ